MTMIGILGFYIKSDKKEVKEKLTENADEIEKLNERFRALERDLPFTYVTRDDYIRQMARMENKLDKIYQRIEKGGGGNE
ncbi:hypothetical protein BALCAV_0213625 [Alkalihalobacillus alcalophilus ATCC 27647 = CGMCC 1.3604]|nr:hypothetical protein BALCAV_0213625 [Alkalihalobacillus alcalophilus ATCC 27647 = CGMCC 1.3604]